MRAMRILEFPGDVAMGGIEAQAERLADDAARAAAEAESLAIALLRGDWRGACGSNDEGGRTLFPVRLQPRR